jgi:hypothetical protein
MPSTVANARARPGRRHARTGPGFARRRASAKVFQGAPVTRGARGCSAVVAHHLAKVRVASSNLVIRSSAGVSLKGGQGTWGQTTRGGVAERLGTGLQSRLHGFESRRHLHLQLNSPLGAIGAAVARFPDTEEVTGSIPVSRTTKPPDFRGFSRFRRAASRGGDEHRNRCRNRKHGCSASFSGHFSCPDDQAPASGA